MKHLINRTALILVVCAMASISALAVTTSRQVTFNNPVMVNGMSVKAGTYKATFDDQTGEFTLKSGKKIVAKATARLEKTDGRYRGAYATQSNGMNIDLISIDMSSGNQAVIVNDGASME